MEVTATKAVVLVLLGLIKLCCGLAPLVLTRVLKGRDRCLKKFIGEQTCRLVVFLSCPLVLKGWDIEVHR